MNVSGDLLLFDFSAPESFESWGSIDDQVMGGVSQSQFAQSGSGVAVFSGSISFEHHGGFASVRTAPGSYDLSAYSGLEMHLHGDGKRYKLSLTTDPRFESVTYRAPFDTKMGKWVTVRIPFDHFQPTFRGQIVPDAPPLDPGSIRTFGFLISDRQEGAFRLEVKWIKAYSD